MLDAGGNAFWEGSNFAAKTTYKGEVGFWVYVFHDKGDVVGGKVEYWAWRNVPYPRAVRLCFVF